jgi:predicted short-subunit dehydrogenase-like oxidoreductase (DUF2520 family)
MARKPSITIIGLGNLGTALATALSAAGYRIDEIVIRPGSASQSRARALARRLGARVAMLESANLTAGIVWVCVKDADIAATARALAPAYEWKGKIVLHSSGALTSDELNALRRRGAAVASLHPMMTFPRAAASPGEAGPAARRGIGVLGWEGRRATPIAPGVGFAVEGDPAAVRAARRLVADLHGMIFPLKKAAKPLYHAWGAFASPLLIAELAQAERVARAAGVTGARARQIVEPIVRRTIDNYFRHGAADAFSGPLIRGDVATVRHHLQQLGRIPGAREVYLALARSALRNLPVGNRKQMQRALGIS